MKLTHSSSWLHSVTLVQTLSVVVVAAASRKVPAVHTVTLLHTVSAATVHEAAWYLDGRMSTMGVHVGFGGFVSERDHMHMPPVSSWQRPSTHRRRSHTPPTMLQGQTYSPLRWHVVQGSQTASLSFVHTDLYHCVPVPVGGRDGTGRDRTGQDARVWRVSHDSRQQHVISSASKVMSPTLPVVGRAFT